MKHFKDAFKYLLLPFKNWELTLAYARKYFRYSMRNDIPILISDFHKLVDDFSTLCCDGADGKLNKREEEFIYKLSEEALK